MLDSIYHMTLKVLKIASFGVKTSSFFPLLLKIMEVIAQRY